MASHAHVDEIWIKLGKYGKYQIRQLIITMIASLSMACHVVSVVFIGFKPDHFCTAPEYEIQNITANKPEYWNVTYDECVISNNALNGSGIVERTSCIYGNTFKSTEDRSFVTEWNLVCEKDAFAKMSQTLVSGGMFLGAIATSLADRFGRKPVHCIFNLGLFTVTLLMAFVRNFTIFMVLRFLTGAFQQGMLLTVFTIWVEMFPTDNRTIVGIINAFMWTTSFFLVLPFAYFLRDFGWRTVQLGLSLLSSITLIEYCLIDESLRWLLANNKQEDAKIIIKKAAKLNRVNENEILPLLKTAELKDFEFGVDAENDAMDITDEDNSDCDKIQQGGQLHHRSGRSLSFWEQNMYWINLISVPSLRRNSLVIWATWIVNNLAYYGLVFMMPTLAGDIYMNYLFAGITELVGTFILIFVLKYSNRRNGLILFHVVGGICLIAASAVITITDNTTASLVLTLIGRGAITSSFNGIYLYTPELFPTILRNAGIGIASGFGRFAGMLAPFSVYLADLANWAPGVVFGLLCFIISGLLRLVPETKGKELAQTVEELKDWEKTDRNNT